MEDYFEKCTERVAARISKTDKATITAFRKVRELNESEYIKLAIKNQLKSDKTLYPAQP